ncbi:MAG: type II toxin-antitoxin system RelE/ParE family toxin [Myxococcota bacterium]
MKRYRVEMSPAAHAQADAIAAWWVTNRPAARSLFSDEAQAAEKQLEKTPLVGGRYRRGREGMRRLLLPRTRYHLYYVVDEGALVVRIHAFWHTARGKGPSLR